MNKILYLSGLILLLSGCATAPKSMYSWGSFPQQTYMMYNAPQQATPAAQIIKLEAEIEQAKAKNLAVPPGLYAHLGLMYSQEGNTTKAVQYFELEKQVYPESTVLMNRLLKQMGTNMGQAKS